MEHIFSIPDKLDVHWIKEVRAIVDTWTTYFITLDEFREAVLEKGLKHAKANNGQAYIVDSSKAVPDFIS